MHYYICCHIDIYIVYMDCFIYVCLNIHRVALFYCIIATVFSNKIKLFNPTASVKCFLFVRPKSMFVFVPTQKLNFYLPNKSFIKVLS